MKSPSTIIDAEQHCPGGQPRAEHPDVVAAEQQRDRHQDDRSAEQNPQQPQPAPHPQAVRQPLDAGKSVPLNIRKRIGDVEGRREQR